MRRKSSVATCPRCGAGSQIENTLKQDTGYVKRLRACVSCPATWSTAEVHLSEIKKLKALGKLLKALNGQR